MTVVRVACPSSAEHADRPALLGSTTITYGEIVQTADRMAAGLRTLGATVGDRVVIWMTKSAEYALAIIGVLNAGCVYVPVDGSHPPERVRSIVHDTEPIAIFTDLNHLGELTDIPLPSSVKAVVIDAEDARALSWTELRARAERDMPAPEPATLTADDLAAILYTSGSTGAPKGVQVSHRNLASFINWARDEMDVGPGDVFANHASFNFDLSTFDLFVALSVGAAVWIVEDEQARDAGALAAGIREYEVTVWYSVPSILTMMASCGALTVEIARSLRYVLFAGEVYPKPRLRELLALLDPKTAVYNLYGPTETNVCTYHRLTAADRDDEGPLPIGLPVTGATVHIVDPDTRTPADPLEEGELVIEGDCVTPGYWRRESEAAAAHHARHLHFTGDLVGWVDGRLTYRGRKDRMVKVSGYRIELGEIESVVLRHPLIEEAAVIVTDEGAAARIALFYTAREDSPPPSLLDLKSHCARYLPRYMVPRSAARVPALPRNSNGKVDYRILAGRNRP
ncbi:amino acid adenylation domain-containing protein [Nocardia sp. NPDC050435]|uniref:amino acid adenylation domain-containing protein n=1 Tax=Nocardia sp. NPDC050435 TaxID=3155040 RepID=UPI0033EE1E6D